MSYARLVCSVIALALTSACGPAPVDTSENVPAPYPIAVSCGLDATLCEAMNWGMAWWADAGMPIPLVNAASDDVPADAASGSITWGDVSQVGAPAGAEHLAITTGTSVVVEPKVANLPTEFRHAVIAHELGHVMGLGHALSDQVENLMSPAPDIAAGELCIERDGRDTCRDLH